MTIDRIYIYPTQLPLPIMSKSDDLHHFTAGEEGKHVYYSSDLMSEPTST